MPRSAQCRPSTAVTGWAYTGPGITGPWGITAGPDGALWFTNRTGNTIGRITTTGKVKTFSGTGISAPEGITAGPDGNLWFTTDTTVNEDSIGRITTTGTVTTSFLGSTGPWGITAGPDGNLWFTNHTGNTIGRITTSGNISLFGDPGISGPEGITAGPDGALWFTNHTGNTIWRYTTSNQVTSYTAPGISGPQGIAAGPDGAMWFTNHTGNSIGRISATGKVTTYTATTVSGPAGIMAGRDGAMWFTNSTGNSIGRITTAIISTHSFAGYQAAVTAGSPNSSATSFTVPKLSCTTAARAITPSAGVSVNSHKTFSTAFLFTGCVNGTAVYYPGLVINGTETDYPGSPFTAGDVVNLATGVTTSGTTVQITNVTTGVTKKLTGAGASSSAVFIGDNGWATSAGTLLGVPKFGTLTFTNCLINGNPLGVQQSHEYQRMNHAGIVQIAPGALYSEGTVFATYYNHS